MAIGLPVPVSDADFKQTRFTKREREIAKVKNNQNRNWDTSKGY